MVLRSTTDLTWLSRGIRTFCDPVKALRMDSEHPLKKVQEPGIKGTLYVSRC